MAKKAEIVQVGVAEESTVETTETAVVLPLIGLVVNLENPSEVAKALGAVRQAKQKLDEARAGLERILVEEGERIGSKTLHLDGVEASITGGKKLQWDIETLQQLQEIGLPEARFDELVKAEVTYKVNANVAKSIAGANPEYAKVIEAAKEYVDVPWRVSVQ